MTQAQPQTESSISPSAGEIQVILIPPTVRSEEIDREITKHLEPSIAYSRGRMDMDQVFELRDKEQVQIFLTFEDGQIIGVTVTEVMEWTTGLRCLKVLIAGGRGALEHGLDLTLEKMEEFAKIADCELIIVEGRKGWGRALPDGYEYTHSVFEKGIV
jgi:hypothetical protein